MGHSTLINTSRLNLFRGIETGGMFAPAGNRVSEALASSITFLQFCIACPHNLASVELCRDRSIVSPRQVSDLLKSQQNFRHWTIFRNGWRQRETTRLQLS